MTRINKKQKHAVNQTVNISLLLHSIHTPTLHAQKRASNQHSSPSLMPTPRPYINASSKWTTSCGINAVFRTWQQTQRQALGNCLPGNSANCSFLTICPLHDRLFSASVASGVACVVTENFAYRIICKCDAIDVSGGKEAVKERNPEESNQIILPCTGIGYRFRQRFLVNLAGYHHHVIFPLLSYFASCDPLPFLLPHSVYAIEFDKVRPPVIRIWERNAYLWVSVGDPDSHPDEWKILFDEKIRWWGGCF